MQKISCEMWLLIEFASGRNWWWNYVCWKSCQNHKWINFRLNWRLAIEFGRLSTVRQYVIFGQNQHFSGAKGRESPVSFWLGWSMTKPTKMGFITIDNPENNVAKFGILSFALHTPFQSNLNHCRRKVLIVFAFRCVAMLVVHWPKFPLKHTTISFMRRRMSIKIVLTIDLTI